jgi:hypothetical protein
MGYTLKFAERLDLTKTVPRGDLASTGFCLADSDSQYLVYLPDGGTVVVDLSDTTRTLSVEWFDPETGTSTNSASIEGGTNHEFNAPFNIDAVLFLAAN